MMGRRRASAGATHKRAAAPEGVGRDCRSDLGVCAGVRVCVRGAEAGAAKGAGPALAGRRAGRGPGCVCAGCAFGRGAVRRGRSGSGEKRPYPLSLSLRFVFSTLSCRRCALHLAPGAICASAVVVGSTLADSDSVSCTLPSPAPPSGAAQTPRHLQRHQKGLCWGACRLYPGLRGCGSSSRKEGAESCCLLRVRSGVKATKKRSEAWGRGQGAFLVPCSLLSCPARPGGAVNVEGGAVCVYGGHSERGGASLSLSLWALSIYMLSLPPRAPLPECYALSRRKVCVDGMLVREKALGGVLERRRRRKSMR